MTKLLSPCAALAFALTAHAQSVTTGDEHVGMEELVSPPPLLTFVSPDTSLVARPEEKASVTIARPPMRLKIEASAERDPTPAIVFHTQAPKIIVHWQGENLPVGGSVRLAWVAEDVGDLVEPNFIVDQTTIDVTSTGFGARFTLARPTDGWAPGKYRVDLFVDDVLKDTLGVTIRE